MEGTKEYTSWCGMKYRCYNPSCKKYKNYGGRGIKVCDRWISSFVAFYEDMGPRPSPQHSIERNDVNGDYEPSNCRWATNREQANNRRSNHTITIGSDTKTITQWCEVYGVVKPSRALTRINKFGWEPLKAVTTPHRKMTYKPT